MNILLSAAWSAQVIDYHALAPEIVLAGGLCLVLLADLFLDESQIGRAHV